MAKNRSGAADGPAIESRRVCSFLGDERAALHLLNDLKVPFETPAWGQTTSG
jgi:hypothetical protein